MENLSQAASATSRRAAASPPMSICTDSADTTRASRNSASPSASLLSATTGEPTSRATRRIENKATDMFV